MPAAGSYRFTSQDGECCSNALKFSLRSIIDCNTNESRTTSIHFNHTAKQNCIMQYTDCSRSTPSRQLLLFVCPTGCAAAVEAGCLSKCITIESSASTPMRSNRSSYTSAGAHVGKSYGAMMNGSKIAEL